MHQNYEVMVGLNYRSIGNLHENVFSTYENESMTTLMTLPCTIRVQAGIVKKFADLFHSYTFLFLRVLFMRPLLNFSFSTKFYILLNILRSLSIS